MPSRNTKEKPSISVTKNSRPEEILHSSWTFINTIQFFKQFREYFELPVVDIEKIEKGLLLCQWSKESNELSQTEQDTCSFLIKIIAPLLKTRQRLTLNVNTLDQHLFALFPEISTPFCSLSIIDKINLLKDIQDLHMESQDEDFIALKSEKSAEEMRVLPLGSDYQGWVYWYFDDDRLYREIPLPNGKRGQNIMNSDLTFQLMCSTEEEWHQIIKLFEPSNRISNKELSMKITEIGLKVMNKLQIRKASKARNEAKLKREKELELIPKKRSKRLEVKYDEETKRKKLLEIVQQQIELKEYEKREQLKNEKLLLEKEKKELSREEARLRNNVHDFITKLISTSNDKNHLLNLKELRSQLSKNATEKDRLNRMKAWIQLLDLNISIDMNNNNNYIQFKGNDLDKALDDVLFKNTLRIYLTLLMKSKDDNTRFENVYKKLVLSKYQHLNDFCLDLNNELQNDETIQSNAINHLQYVFSN